jgi:hypothetical protein
MRGDEVCILSSAQGHEGGKILVGYPEPPAESVNMQFARTDPAAHGLGAGAELIGNLADRHEARATGRRGHVAAPVSEAAGAMAARTASAAAWRASSRVSAISTSSVEALRATCAELPIGLDGAG